MHEKLQNLRLPLEGHLDLTDRCNNHCRHCWLWLPVNAKEQKEELNFDEVKNIVDDARSMGCRKWSISGGEPMLRPDFPEIFDYITRKAVSYTLNTNGTLITPEIATILKRKGTKMVALYGATKETYDHVTRHPGGFEKVMRGFRYLKEAGAGFMVQLIPMRDNWHEWDKMQELAQSLTLFPSDQVLVARLLTDRQGCYFHSAAAILNGAGMIFVGHSESGKTTTTQLLMDAGVAAANGHSPHQVEILCDDRNIVRCLEDGWWVYGTWSHGDNPLISPNGAPLRAIFFIEQANENTLTPLTDRKEIVRRLLGCVIKPFSQPTGGPKPWILSDGWLEKRLAMSCGSIKALRLW